jgi:hypothetical protein
MSNFAHKVIFLEIDQKRCAKEYGTTNAAGTCAAVLGTTGDVKCHNTRFTCQDPDNYDASEVVTLRLARPQEGLLQYENVLPVLESLSVAPAQINLGAMDRGMSALGRREVVTAKVRDMQYDDMLLDKYRLERATGEASVSAGEVHFEFADGADRLQPQHGAELATVTFTRSGATATRVNAQGLIEVVAADTPRFDYDPVTLACRGLLREDARTNLILRSQEIDNASWVTQNGASVDANVAVSPDGSLNAERINGSSTAQSHAARYQNVTLVAATTYALSFYFKADTVDSCDWGLYDVTAATFRCQARFDASAGTHTVVGGTGTLEFESCGNGWFRLKMVAATGANTAHRFYIYPKIAGTTNSAESHFVWGAQLEAGLAASSYIPTTTASITRNADSAIVDDISAFHNSAEGTMVAEWRVGMLGVTAYVGALYGNAAPSTARINIVQAASNIAENSINNSGFQCSLNGGALTLGGVFRAAFAWRANDFAASGNGGAAQTDNAGTLPTVDRMSIGALGTGNATNGHLRRLTYYPRRLGNADLVALSGSLKHPSLIVPFNNALDPYWSGTLWGKWVARNPYYGSFTARVREGIVGQALADMNVRHYVLDRVEGPAEGFANIVAKDLFTKIEARKAVAPLASTGELNGNITSVATAATLAPAGIGNLEYPASGHLLIGDEVVAFTRVNDTLTLTRAQFGSVAEAHEDEDLVQLCLVYTSDRIEDIIYDLFVTYTNIDPALIDFTAWQSAAAAIPDLYTTVIAEPVAVADLIGELCEQAGVTVYHETSTGAIEFVVLRAGAVSPIVTDNTIIDGTFRHKRQDSKRASQLWVYYGMKNPAEDVDDTRNYHSRVIIGDLASEGPDQHDSAAVRKVFSRFIPQGGRQSAQRCGERLLAMYRDPPLEVEFAQASGTEEAEAIQLARYFGLRAAELQDANGRQTTAILAAIEVERGEDRTTIKGQGVKFIAEDDDGVRRIYIENDVYNINLRTLHDTHYTAPVGDEVIEFIVQPGIRVGSTSTGVAAAVTGAWPAMTTKPLLKFAEPPLAAPKGRIQGKGGAGGAGASSFSTGSPGSSGGPAFKADVLFSIDNEFGEIFGGGGGGGGGGGNAVVAWGGGGGGGGAGVNGGAGGNGGFGLSGSGGPGGAGTADGGGGGGPAATGGAGAGGAGGGPGLAGASGQTVDLAGGSGGGAGNAVEGNSNITWVNFGDRRGGIV